VGFGTKEEGRKEEGKKTVTGEKPNIFYHTHNPRIETML